MDPNVTLRELREAVVQLERLNTPDAPNDVHAATNAVLERWSALDTWISNGGFFPSAWTEAQRRALENTRCERPTLAGTTVPVPCPPTHQDPFANELGTREIGAYDDPAVQRAIGELLRTNTWEA